MSTSAAKRKERRKSLEKKQNIQKNLEFYKKKSAKRKEKRKSSEKQVKSNCVYCCLYFLFQ